MTGSARSGAPVLSVPTRYHDGLLRQPGSADLPVPDDPQRRRMPSNSSATWLSGAACRRPDVHPVGDVARVILAECLKGEVHRT
jgi:hypothetical protein